MTSRASPSRAAGASTRAHRDLEVTRAGQRGRERDLVAVVVVLLLPALTYVLSRAAMSRLEAVGIAGFVLVLLAAWRRGAASADEERVARWASGAWGEEATAVALDRLLGEGFGVVHDLPVPGRRENLDHVVVGRGGIAVVETKRWAGRVVVGRHVRVDGRRRDEVIAQVTRQRHALARALGRASGGVDVDVDGFVCIHARQVRPAWYRRRAEIAGITFGGPDDLVRWLRRRRRRRAFSRGDIREVVEVLERLRLESVPAR